MASLNDRLKRLEQTRNARASSNEKRPHIERLRKSCVAYRPRSTHTATQDQFSGNSAATTCSSS
jgi:hypothetical protein